MKKIFVSIGTLTSGGAERVLSVLSKSLADTFEVEYFIWISKPIFYEIDERIIIIDIEKQSGSTNLIKKMLWFRKYVKRHHPDLILSFLYPWSIKLIISLLFIKVKIVAAERLDGRMVVGGYLVKLLRDLLYLKTTGILVQTNKNRDYYLKPLRKKISVIYNPVIMRKDFLGSALNCKKEKLIVTVGRLHEQKNHELLIKAFAHFHQSHSDYRLIIYGEGHLKESLITLISELNLTGYVSLPGAIQNVFSEIKQAKIFVLSSNYEGMPNALLEAMCLGLPCISTKVSGAEELIKDRDNGILVDIGDEEGLSVAMTKLADDNDLSLKISQNAVLLYEKLNRDKIEREWVNYIDEIKN